jgi:hypothetical protein
MRCTFASHLAAYNTESAHAPGEDLRELIIYVFIKNILTLNLLSKYFKLSQQNPSSTATKR